MGPEYTFAFIYDFILRAYSGIQAFLHSPVGETSLFALKIVSGIFSLTLLLGVIYLIIRTEMIPGKIKKVNQFLNAKPFKTEKK